MRPSSRASRWLAGAGLAGLLALGSAACGGGDEEGVEDEIQQEATEQVTEETS